MIARLCSLAIESSAMIKPDRQIDLKSPPSLMILMTTLTSCFANDLFCRNVAASKMLHYQDDMQLESL